jgi:hypothetical protein
MAQARFRRTISLPLTTFAMLAPGFVLVPSTAFALDVNVQPRINTGAMYYELDVEDTFALDDVLPFIGGGATVFMDRFYVDVYGQGAYSGGDELQQLQGDDLAQPVDIDWDRAEYSAAAGFLVTENLSVFAGYRRSETEFELPDGDFFDYENDGPFVGANYGWPLSLNEWLEGTLSFNLAAAQFDGEITFADPNLPEITGDTVSFTAGVTWIGNLLEGTGSGLFANGLNYTIGVDGYAYNFDQDNVAGSSGDEISETVIRGSVGLAVPFDF